MADLNFAAYGSVTANYYIEIPAAQIAIASGDVFFFTMTRNSGDGYGGDVGFLQLGYRIITG